METTLDKLGRVLLPKAIRDDLGLGPGAVLRIEERDAGIFLKPEATAEAGDPHLIRKGGVLVFTGQAEGDLDSAIRRDREERDGTVAGIKLT